MQLTLKKKSKDKPLQPKYILNLADYNKKPLNMTRFILLLILIVIAAVAFGKFAVLDRFVALDQARSEAASLQAQIDANYAQLQEMEGVTEEYAHYTFSGMTEDELSLVSRVDVMSMIDRLVLPYASVSTWTLQGNTLNMTIYNTSLNRVNSIVASINQEPIVNYSFVQTAATDSSSEYRGADVSAQITVYLQIPEDKKEDSK